MTTLFTNETDPAVDHFALFWKKFPRDPVNRSRKAGKAEARKIWGREKLDARFDHIMAVLDEDIADIKKGVYAFCVNSNDKMHFYKGVVPWLRAKKYDRDLAPVSPPKPLTPVGGPVMDKPRTPEEDAKIKEHFAKVRQMLKRGKPPVAEVVDVDGTTIRRTSVS